MDIDWNFVTDSLPLYLEAAILTLKLGFIGIILSLIIGLICSIVLYFKIKVLDKIVQAYIELSRNNPLLVQIFFLYFGFPKLGLKMNETTCAVIGLAFLGGSYMAEAFRSGLEAVSKSQIECGISIGLSKLQLIRYVIIPQAFSISIPSISANFIFLLKETSVLGAISIIEVTNLTKDLIGMYYRTFEALAMLVVAYLIIVLPVSFILTLFERKLRYAEFGN
ncbi:amino acid ABC transporter permease [Clostridium sp. SM-530-WT-3G]|uniref:amino acid ABC transporter permease n=1 Tax=Clostridium sp. SM-530-WT-3G TaxID=2725303 RepID=UPI00145D24FC|nr:amino acid ABC transporter permease [Clostridium sp. SM-530-WT-3G]NME84211.1 amino acid ABC transporter permease [Clostridium sp. SM-530-WT-3G]